MSMPMRKAYWVSRANNRMDSTANGESYSHFFPIGSTTSRQPSFQRRGSAAAQPSSSNFVDRSNRLENPQQHEKQQKMAEDQAYRATFASHERAVYREEIHARARRYSVAHHRIMLPKRLYKRPEFYAISMGVLGLIYPIVNQYIIQPWYETTRQKPIVPPIPTPCS
ncbi:hypothetical protein M426DRAFT_121654 [Hypoxylon sp. CI-4A]|nr:hypothetical protein M426DRAFT_121654 [Hypoxylon sp. CI-4A]